MSNCNILKNYSTKKNNCGKFTAYLVIVHIFLEHCIKLKNIVQIMARYPLQSQLYPLKEQQYIIDKYMRQIMSHLSRIAPAEAMNQRPD